MYLSFTWGKHQQKDPALSSKSDSSFWDFDTPMLDDQVINTYG